MKVPVVVMRGGTSKGVFLNFEHMPSNRSHWEDFLLDVMGSPDRRQIDGLGGANSLTSKAAIIKKSIHRNSMWNIHLRRSASIIKWLILKEIVVIFHLL